MDRARTLRLMRLAAIPIVGAAAFAAACGGGGDVSQDDYDKAKSEQASAVAEADKAKVEVAKLQTQIATKPTTPAGSPTAAADAVTVLIAAKAVPPTTPTPAPTLPPGVTPTAAPTRPPMPASYNQPVTGFYAWIEVMATTRASTYNVVGTQSCIITGAFKRGQRIVIRTEVIDMRTGLRLTADNAESVTVVWENGDKSVGRFSQRGGGANPTAPWMWSATWDIPLNYKLGAVDFTLEVKMKDGTTGTFTPPYIESNTPTGSETRPKVYE